MLVLISFFFFFSFLISWWRIHSNEDWSNSSCIKENKIVQKFYLWKTFLKSHVTWPRKLVCQSPMLILKFGQLNWFWNFVSLIVLFGCCSCCCFYFWFPYQFTLQWLRILVCEAFSYGIRHIDCDSLKYDLLLLSVTMEYTISFTELCSLCNISRTNLRSYSAIKTPKVWAHIWSCLTNVWVY